MVTQAVGLGNPMIKKEWSRRSLCGRDILREKEERDG